MSPRRRRVPAGTDSVHACPSVSVPRISKTNNWERSGEMAVTIGFVNGLGIPDVSPSAIEACASAFFNEIFSLMYNLEPSVNTTDLAMPSWVIWFVPSTLGGGSGLLSQVNAAPKTATRIKAAAIQNQRDPLTLVLSPVLTAAACPEVVSRLRRLRSARSSEAC